MALARPVDTEALRRAGEWARPVALAGEQLLAVLAPLAPLFPEGGLRRGSTVTVEAGPGATSLALALGAAASAAGSWVAGWAWPRPDCWPRPSWAWPWSGWWWPRSPRTGGPRWWPPCSTPSTWCGPASPAGCRLETPGAWLPGPGSGARSWCPWPRGPPPPAGRVPRGWLAPGGRRPPAHRRLVCLVGLGRSRRGPAPGAWRPAGWRWWPSAGGCRPGSGGWPVAARPRRRGGPGGEAGGAAVTATGGEAPVRTLVVWCPDWEVAAAGRDGGVPVAGVAADGGRPGPSRPWLGPWPRSPPVSRCCAPALALPGGAPRGAVALLRGRCRPGHPGRGPGRRRPGGAGGKGPVPGGRGRRALRRGAGRSPGAGGRARGQRRLFGPPDRGCPRPRRPPAGVADLVGLFRRLGLRTLGDVAAVSPATLAGRFGPAGARVSRLCRGLDDRRPRPRVPPPNAQRGRRARPSGHPVGGGRVRGPHPGRRPLLCSAWPPSGAWPVRRALRCASRPRPSTARRCHGGGAPRATRPWPRPWWSGPAGSSTVGATPRRHCGPAGDRPACAWCPRRSPPDRGRQLGFWGGATAADERGGPGDRPAPGAAGARGGGRAP